MTDNIDITRAYYKLHILGLNLPQKIDRMPDDIRAISEAPVSSHNYELDLKPYKSYGMISYTD